MRPATNVGYLLLLVLPAEARSMTDAQLAAGVSASELPNCSAGIVWLQHGA